MISAIKAIVTIIALLVQMYREGQIKGQAQDEIVKGLAERALAAKKAEQGELPDEDTDPNNRARPRFDGMHDGDSKPPLSVG